MSIIFDEPMAQLSSSELEFQQRLSKKPYCSDDLEYGLQIRNKQVALSKKYIQANTPFNLSWLCFDIDYPCVLETTFKEKILPLPNLIVINPINHHSHLLYGIEDKIHLTDNSHIHPIRYAQAVSYSLREALKADNGYTGLIIKNPHHDIWNTIEVEKNLWSLNSLSEYLVLPKQMPKRENLIGLGRNCTLFELGRKYAYSEVLKQKIIGNKQSFYNTVLYFIEQQNQDFPEPLLYNEYKAIAKSITNWTWKHYGDKTTKQWAMYVKNTHSVEIQSWRGKQNTSQQQAVKGQLGGKNNTTEQQSIKGQLGGRNNTSEQQAIKGQLGGKNNTTEQQSIKGQLGGRNNTSEQQAIKGQLGGKNNTTEQQAIKGKLGGKNNAIEQQIIKGKLGAIKSAQVRFNGSNEQLKPWESLAISRRSYYYKKNKGLIKN